MIYAQERFLSFRFDTGGGRKIIVTARREFSDYVRSIFMAHPDLCGRSVKKSKSAKPTRYKI